MLDDLARKVAENVMRYAQENFASAQYAGPSEDKENTYELNKEGDGHYTVTITGPAVLWIEYGTGVNAKGTNKNPLPPNYEQGEGQAGKPSHPDGADYWYFWGDERHEGNELIHQSSRKDNLFSTKGNEANNCVYDAIQRAKENL